METVRLWPEFGRQHGQITLICICKIKMQKLAVQMQVQMTGQLSWSMQIAWKYWQAERQYKMRCTRQLREYLFLHFAEQPRLWLINYYSSQLSSLIRGRCLDGRSSTAIRWVWQFLKTDESVCPRSVVDLKDSGDELMPTKCPHSSHPSNLQDRSPLMPLRRKACKGEESPNAPAWKSAWRRGVT